MQCRPTCHSDCPGLLSAAAALSFLLNQTRRHRPPRRGALRDRGAVRSCRCEGQATAAVLCFGAVAAAAWQTRKWAAVDCAADGAGPGRKSAASVLKFGNALDSDSARGGRARVRVQTSVTTRNQSHVIKMQYGHIHGDRGSLNTPSPSASVPRRAAVTVACGRARAAARRASATVPRTRAGRAED